MIRSQLRVACVGILLTLACGAAGAQDATDTRTLDAKLTLDDGMTLVSDGLYALTVGTTQSYVAVNATGQQALLGILRKLRAPGGKRGHAGGPFDALITTLSTPVPLNQDLFGDCLGSRPGVSGPFEARALAGGGIGGGLYGASGLASNSSHNPTILTTNRVAVEVDDANGNIIAQQDTTTYGNTTASASAFAGQAGCTANSYVTLTCPGSARPAIVATAYNRRTGCVIN